MIEVEFVIEVEFEVVFWIYWYFLSYKPIFYIFFWIVKNTFE